MHSQKRLSILCPNCRKLISRDVGRCPYCGIANPGSKWKNTIFSRWFGQADLLISAIVWANIAMYVLSLIFNPRLTSFSMNPLTFLSPDNKSLYLLGATGMVPVFSFGRVWTLVAANFLHGSILHIVFNMIALKQLAPVVVQEYGTHRMFIIYLASGIFGFFVSCLAGVSFTIGASAAICGLIGSILYFGKSRGGDYGRAVFSQVGGWALSIFAFGFLVPGINNWGHGGGMLAGIIFGFLLGYEGKVAEKKFHKILALFGMLLTVVILLWATAMTLLMQLLA
jgi:rhomboid protease GluP